MCIKIAITGPESTGKTTLTEALCKHFTAFLVPEFARTYLIQNGNKQDYETILFMAHQQIMLENEALKAKHPLIICDTDLFNYKIWLEYLQFPVPNFIEEHLENQAYTHSLLLLPNIPWKADKLRSNSHNRWELFNEFDKLLQDYNQPFSKIDKLEKDRTAQAIQEINKILWF